MTKILLLQGANMNWLGKREPEKYGTTTAAELDAMLQDHARLRGITLDIRYTNAMGEAVDLLYGAEEGDTDCVVMNPGGFSYSGEAIRDCILGIELPVVEVHMTNHFARGIESVTASAARCVLLGAGIDTYFLGLDAALRVVARGTA
jgi:3-dehydroquinate dehydratase-2